MLSGFFNHVPRSKNKRADQLANSALDAERSSETWFSEGSNRAFQWFWDRSGGASAEGLDAPRVVLQCWFDGAFRGSVRKGSFGVCLQLVGMRGKRVLFRETVCETSYLSEVFDSYQAERAGAIHAIKIVAKFASKVFEHIRHSVLPVHSRSR